MKKPDAIIVGDIHYRDDQPVCRTDDFWETQKRKAVWLRGLWEDNGKPIVLQPGDVFHRWKSSPQVISTVLKYFPPMITIPGNHDLPNHNLELFDKSALAVIEQHQDWSVERFWRDLGQMDLMTFPWGIEPVRSRKDYSTTINVMMAHTMIVDSEIPFEGEMADSFLRRMKGYDLIITGHNHKPILKHHYARDNSRVQILVNPGSFTRQSADENHKPRVYLWYAKDNRLEEVFVPIEEGVITSDHLDKKITRDERISAFVESLVDNQLESTVNFIDYAVWKMNNSKIRETVKTRIMEALEHEP